MKLIKEYRVFGGQQQRYSHAADTTQCEMNFSIFLPPQSSSAPCPVLYWLSGLTCSDENFMQKAGAQRLASQLGLIIVAPDTSPRGDGVADAPDGAYDLGLGAGFYVNATQAPWRKHYQMYDYIVDELYTLVSTHFPVTEQCAISGHSMGGHGALVIGFRNSARYRSISAFSPIVNPLQCPWGQKAFRHYLGDDAGQWQPYDSCALISQVQSPRPLLIDQGTDDEFLSTQLMPERLQAAAQAAAYPLELRMQAGYDHSYYFIASFIDEHLRFHARHLGIPSAS